jgi:transcriptional regulator with XRE-family HTH domain
MAGSRYLARVSTQGPLAVESQLGDFLRTRRARLHPEEVGLPRNGSRRVAGLRREELALLSGLSADYYVRLEQGRQRPSVQVVEALSRALRLNDVETAYLTDLSRANPETDEPSREPETAQVNLQILLDQWTSTPAWVSDRCSYVIAANSLAHALNPACVPGVPMTRNMFLEEEAKREIYVDYDDIAALAVASLRLRNAGNFHDPRLQALVAELTDASPLFRKLWTSHDVSYHALGPKRIRHPVVGQIDYRSEAMWVADTDHYILTIYYVEPGTPSATNHAKLCGYLDGLHQHGRAPLI